MLENSISTITLDEAVALLVNLDYIPEGFDSIGMTSAYLEIAEIDYENAVVERVPSEKLEQLKARLDACRNRHQLASAIIEALNYEIVNAQDPIVVIESDSAGDIRLTIESIAEWAFEKMGISIKLPINNLEIQNQTKWEDITIKIYADYRLGYRVDKGSYKQMSFRDVGLMGTKKLVPNEVGGILIGLSQKKKFPLNNKPSSADKTAFSKLRKALRDLTGLSTDPFYEYKVDQGWKPKFQLFDARNASAERAKKDAVHVEYDEKNLYQTKDFEDEEDEAASFLRERDK